MTVYPSLRDYAEIAAELLGATSDQILRLPRIGLADSALAAPRSGLGSEEAYPELVEKAAVLIGHLVGNHPLPDGNKRAAFLTAILFLELNDHPVAPDHPDIDAPLVEAIAAGQTSRAQIEAWVRRRAKP